MAVDTTYRKSSPALLNYSVTDTLTNTGYLTLYGLQAEDSTGNVYILATDSGLYSRTTSTTQAENTAATNYDFDIELNRHISLEGEAYVQVSIQSESKYGSAETFDTTVALELYHDTTQLGSTITEVVSSPGTNQTAYQVQQAKITVPRTEVPRNDTIRLRVIITTNNSNNSNSVGRIWHSPANEDADSNNRTTQLIVKLPTPLDV